MIALLAGQLRGGIPTFIATFAGLAFETIPFLLVGTLLSAFIHELVPGPLLRRLFPKNRYLSMVTALFLGAFLPMCECGTVPVANSLQRKGLPRSTAGAFLLAAPLVSPITILSTVAAFQGDARPVFLFRLGFGVMAAGCIAALVELGTRFARPAADRVEPRTTSEPDPAESQPGERGRMSAWARAGEILEHTSHDFLDTARFLVLGITLASLVRVFIPTESAGSLSWSAAAAAGLGLALAYVLSLCSAADAFVARSLLAGLPFSATMAFLLLGPMIDMKNTVLLSRFIQPRQLVVFLTVIFCVDFAAALASGWLAGGGP